MFILLGPVIPILRICPRMIIFLHKDFVGEYILSKGCHLSCSNFPEGLPPLLRLCEAIPSQFSPLRGGSERDPVISASFSEFFEPQECYLRSISFPLQVIEKEKGKSV